MGSAENDRSHAEISFRICWWGSWVLVTSEVTRHLNDDSGNFGIPRTFWAFQEPFWPGPGSMGPTVPARDPWVPIGPIGSVRTEARSVSEKWVGEAERDYIEQPIPSKYAVQLDRTALALAKRLCVS